MEPTTVTEEVRPWRPFRQGGFLDIDVDELEGFGWRHSSTMMPLMMVLMKMVATF
jgi:hypothetical protein